jgi:hypothetical protein
MLSLLDRQNFLQPIDCYLYIIIHDLAEIGCCVMSNDGQVKHPPPSFSYSLKMWI